MGNSPDGYPTTEERCGTSHVDLQQPLDVRTLRVNSGDVVVISSTDETLDESTARAFLLRQLFEESGITGTLILVLRPGVTVESLSEDQMRELGWIRAGDPVPTN